MSVKAVTNPRKLAASVPEVGRTGALHAFATAAALAAAVALAALGLLRFTGHVVLVAPAIHAGDLLITRVVPARTVRPGDVVTFADPTREGRSVTHRVVSVSGDRELEFVTRGGANGASERWTVEADDTVGRLRVALPSAGRTIAWLGGPHGRIVLVVVPLLYLGFVALRRIWS
jgi:signal peptidase I